MASFVWLSIVSFRVLSFGVGSWRYWSFDFLSSLKIKQLETLLPLFYQSLSFVYVVYFVYLLYTFIRVFFLCRFLPRIYFYIFSAP